MLDMRFHILNREEYEREIIFGGVHEVEASL